MNLYDLKASIAPLDLSSLNGLTIYLALQFCAMNCTHVEFEKEGLAEVCKACSGDIVIVISLKSKSKFLETNIAAI